jgi:hypothetical protein
MDNSIMLIIAIAAIVVVVLAIAWWQWREMTRRRLRARFGGEDDRVARERGLSVAQRELGSRVSRVEALDIRQLAQDERARFGASWREVQARFVDDPPGAVAGADALVGSVMQARGYPVSDFEQRAADLSVDHPRFVENFRQAHAIAVEQSRGRVGTEDLRRAMVHYRALFEDLLGRDGDVEREAELPAAEKMR